jgi:hypothetical protein
MDGMIAWPSTRETKSMQKQGDCPLDPGAPAVQDDTEFLGCKLLPRGGDLREGSEKEREGARRSPRGRACPQVVPPDTFSNDYCSGKADFILRLRVHHTITHGVHWGAPGAHWGAIRTA